MDMKRNRKEHERQGATLRFIREQRGVTQQELATHLNISRAFLANIEAGRRALTPILARAACNVLKIRPIVLVNEDFLRQEKDLSTPTTSQEVTPCKKTNKKG